MKTKRQALSKGIAGLLTVAMATTLVHGQRIHPPVPVPVRLETLPSRELYVPKPKPDTLDTSTTAPSTRQADTVLTLEGDLLTGTVIDINAGEKLRLTGPQFANDIAVFVKSLDRVSLSSNAAESGRDEVVMTNSDRVIGEVTDITPDAVVVTTAATGPLTIGRNVVRCINFATGRTLLLESHFDDGEMEPWKTARGNWSVSKGKLVSNSHGSRETVFAEIQQAEPITFEAKVEAIGGNYIHCDILLFAENAQSSYGHNAIWIRFQSSYCYIGYVRNGGTNHITNRQIGQTIRSGVLRVAYDPQTAKVRVWMNAMDLGEYTIPNNPRTGKYVMFGSQYPCMVSYLRLRRGIAAPVDGAEGKAEADSNVVQFANKDRVSTTAVSLADGTFTAETPYGQLNGPVENVQSVAFATKGQERPRRRKEDILAQTAGSKLTFQLEKLTDTYLTGNSDYLGQVKILRSALKEIRFNVYKK